MTEKLCPVCNRPNSSTAKKCWYCQSLLDDEMGDIDAGADTRAETSAGQSDDAEVPEWLARIRRRKAIEEMHANQSGGDEGKTSDNLKAALTEPSQPAPKDTAPLPSWIADLGETAPPEETAKSQPLEQEKEPEGIDWLKKLNEWKNQDSSQPESLAAEEPVKAEDHPPEKSTPEWLAEFLAPSAPAAAGDASEPAPEPSSMPQEENALPDTGELKDSNLEDALTRDETYDFSQEDSQPTPDEQPSEGGPSALEEGFTPLDTIIPAESTPEPPDAIKEAAKINGSDLDWLEQYRESTPEEAPESGETVPTFTGETKSSAPFLGVQQDDWKALPGEPDHVTPREEIAPEGVIQGALPAWMQNLAPGETKPEAKTAAEDIGSLDSPLSGIQGALMGAGLTGLDETPSIYTNKVQVTDRQNLRADLLHNLLSEPAAVTPAVESKKPARGHLTRVLISVLLLAAVFAVLIMAPGTSLLPVIYPPETANAYSILNNLPADRPVLVAADFEAGLSGEIGFTTQAVLEHLMLRDVPLATLSTNPVGSTLMDQMLSAAQGTVTSYDLAGRVVRFGYLAGGSVGIQSLTSDLRGTLPFSASLLPAWDYPGLQNIHKLSDFSALIVVTDDADTGRYWVEQVQSSLNGTPLILVTSAQAAPMLQPYYESGQVRGVVAGLTGGSAYEQILQLPGNSSYFFGAYQVLILLAAVVIFIGGMVSLLRPSKV